MQTAKEADTMLSKNINPNYTPIQETESKRLKPKYFPELEKPILVSEDSTEVQKSKLNWKEDEERCRCNAITSATVANRRERTAEESSCSGRERLKRHRVEVAGRVWIPDIWGQEDFLKDWIDCAAFDASLANSRIMSARASLVNEGLGRRPNSTGLRIENGY